MTDIRYEKGIRMIVSVQIMLSFSDFLDETCYLGCKFSYFENKFRYGSFKYYISMFLAFLGPPTHLCQRAEVVL